mmetsp:Transcript_29084/g.81390  ORF Transcript_29084/g.81390 Transcript_29084/m.81390 type:complete len:254 (+) Transcript_29084:2356-3117(+)
MSRPRAIVSIPPMWAYRMSSGLVLSRRSLASKLSPPEPRPPCSRTTFIRRAASRWSIRNWSVSQPVCGSPVLMSTLPSRPITLDMRSSCSHECPESVAWLHSTLIWKSPSVKPARCRVSAVVAASQSYWCFVGSWGLGSSSRVPVKPMRRLWSKAIRIKVARWDSSRPKSVLIRLMYPSRPPQKTKFSPPSAWVASIAFFTCAAAKANTRASGLVAAPCMYRGCLNSCAVPHSTLAPAAFCSLLATRTMWSRF